MLVVVGPAISTAAASLDRVPAGPKGSSGRQTAAASSRRRPRAWLPAAAASLDRVTQDRTNPPGGKTATAGFRRRRHPAWPPGAAASLDRVTAGWQRAVGSRAAEEAGSERDPNRKIPNLCGQ